MKELTYTVDFESISLRDVSKVGGKNASLGELFNSLKPLGVNVLDGFATTADAFRHFLKDNGLDETLRSLLAEYGVWGAQATALEQLAREGAQRGWWQVQAGTIPSDDYKTLV